MTESYHSSWRFRLGLIAAHFLPLAPQRWLVRHLIIREIEYLTRHLTPLQKRMLLDRAIADASHSPETHPYAKP